MHLAALTPAAKKLWPKLKQFPSFSLAGGTALALQIGHRISVDFDLFSEKKIPSFLLAEAEKTFSDAPVRPVINTAEQLTVTVGRVYLSFVFYPFAKVQPLRVYHGVKFFSVAEIGAMKAYALGRRATYKDYTDLYFILAGRHCTLSQLVKLARKKYGEGFEPRLFFEQLVYLADVPKIPIRFLQKPVTKPQLIAFFQEELKKIRL